MTTLVRARNFPGHYIGSVAFIHGRGLAYALTNNKMVALPFSEATAALIVSLANQHQDGDQMEMEEAQGVRYHPHPNCRR